MNIEMFYNNHNNLNSNSLTKFKIFLFRHTIEKGTVVQKKSK